MRTLLAFAALALAAHCACAAPMSMSPYGKQPMQSPYGPERPPPSSFAPDYPPPPPFEPRRPGRPFGDERRSDDEHRHSDGLECMLGRLLDKLINAVTKILGLDDGNGGLWGRLKNAFNDSPYPSSSPPSWTSGPSNFWGNMGNMGNRSVDPWSPSPEPEPYVTTPTYKPKYIKGSPSSPSAQYPFGRPSAPSGSGRASVDVMGFPTNNWMGQGGPRPMYNSMQIKAGVVSSDMNGMPIKPVMAPVGGMQGIMGVPVMDSVQSMQAMPSVPKVSQARPPVQASKPSVAAPSKPAAAVPKAPPKPAVAKQVVPAAVKPGAPAKAGGKGR